VINFPTTTCEVLAGAPDLAWENPQNQSPWLRLAMQFLNTLTVLALVVMSFALIVAVPVLYASSDDSGRSNRLILVGGLLWVALVLVNWGMSFFVV
jgi:photosystem II PsbZ protein